MYIYIDTYIYICIYIYIYIHIHIYMYIYMYVCVCIYSYIHAHTHTTLGLSRANRAGSDGGVGRLGRGEGRRQSKNINDIEIYTDRHIYLPINIGKRGRRQRGNEGVKEEREEARGRRADKEAGSERGCETRRALPRFVGPRAAQACRVPSGGSKCSV